MLDLNHILLFIALASPLVLLIRLARLPEARPAGWAAAAFLVLAATALAWVFWPKAAGFLGGACWALLLLFPSLAERWIARFLLEQRFRPARRLALVRQMLHPWNDFPLRPSLLRGFELAAAGQLPAALDLLAREGSENRAGGRCAIASTFALTQNWPGLVQWSRRDLRVTSDPVVRTLYLRALGETGALEDLAWAFAARHQTLGSRLTTSGRFAQEFLYLLAFSGRVAGVVRLFRTTLAGMPRAQQQFWIATAELAAGEREGARARLTKLRGSTGNAILENAIARRLGQLDDFPVARLAPPTEKLLDHLLAGNTAEFPAPGRRRGHGPIAVWIIICLNLAMFGAELLLGGATNSFTLHRLGALEPNLVLLGHQYWRLFTALFLHYGFLHIAFNLYALYILGPALERMIGSIRFAIGYLLSGLGSSAGVVVLTVIGLTKANQLVGASGCVMGVIGISAGLLLRHRQSPLAGQRLRNILAIVALQTLFDLSTPQVSLAAHLSGFGTGVLIGLVFARRRSGRL